MKNKYLQAIVRVMLILGLFLILTFFLGYSVKSVITFYSTLFLIGLVIILIQAFAIPSKWIINNKFGFLGMILVTWSTIFPLTSTSDEKVLTLGGIIVSIIIGTVIGFFGLGFLFKRNLKSISRKIATDNNIHVSKILIDVAVIKENNKSIYGKLILADKKLLFILGDLNNPLHEIDLYDQSNSFKIHKRFGIPNGIIINDNLKFIVSFPRLWIKKINVA